VRIEAGFEAEKLDARGAEAVLLDAPSATLYGGTGQPFDWKLARGVPGNVVLAGGLDETNVRRAIEEARPWGVDACSRLESAPGRKDHRKMALFLKAALL
jgi:phosphoribosylanthranilate isomerase